MVVFVIWEKHHKGKKNIQWFRSSNLTWGGGGPWGRWITKPLGFCFANTTHFIYHLQSYPFSWVKLAITYTM